VESLPSKKKDPQKKRGREQGLKEDEIYKLLGDILSKERKKGDHIFL
jgi:hypothetical protein